MTASGIKALSVALFWPGDMTPVMWRGQAKSRTIMYRHLLDDVLERLDFPVIGTLRDTQNYPAAAMDGMGIVELAPRRVIKDLLEWRPIMEWLMQNLYPDQLSELDEMFGAIGRGNKG